MVDWFGMSEDFGYPQKFRPIRYNLKSKIYTCPEDGQDWPKLVGRDIGTD